MRVPVKKLFLFLSFCLIIPHLYSEIFASSGWIRNDLPIISPNNSPWVSIVNPSILRLANSTYAVIEVNSGQGWRISSATSIDGLNNWLVNPKQIIEVGDDNNWEKGTSNSYAIYNPNKNRYEMWYSVYGTAGSGDDRYRLRFAYSSDLITWTRYSSAVLRGTPLSWDSGGMQRGLSVLLIGNQYHMWYTGNDSTGQPNWKIGYATSLDGITWVKQNLNNPVLSPTSPQDLNNISFPHVILQNGVYIMWYGTSNYDLPTQFNYAYSYDGINWIKPLDNFQFAVRPTFFDSLVITAPFVIPKDDFYEMYYSGNGPNTLYSIGYATASADVIDVPTPTPNPISPTATPVPPTPTEVPPTPTPVPPTNTPVPPSPTPILPTATPTPKIIVVIPGAVASSNINALFKCADTPQGGTWGYTWNAKSLYDPAIKALQSEGYTVHEFLYDWRLPILTNADKLQAFIQSKIPDGHFNILGHSMGGLIARSYLEKTRTSSRVDKLLTAGSPHEGAVNAYYAWSGGEIYDPDLIFKGLLSGIQFACERLKKVSSLQAIRHYIPSTGDLLPTFPYLERNGTMIPISTMSIHSTWNRDPAFTNPYYGTTTGSIVGIGKPTSLSLTITNPSKNESQQGLWKDGKPIGDQKTSTAGDGTVLEISANSTNNLFETELVKHSDLLADAKSVKDIIRFFTGETVSPLRSSQNISSTIPESPTSLLMFAGTDMAFTVIDPRNHFHRDERGMVQIMNPIKGAYHILIWPKQRNATVMAGIITKEDTKWKAFTFTHWFPRVKTFMYDPKKLPKENHHEERD
jgi:pimeloyl-ACP methyl ester carboxylesterase/predicted GH43/DUF377 family glycosyl hydrolase